jgi:hypothetical protein
MRDKGMNPLVSVVIVNYNAKEYLKSCLNSVLNTDYPNFEVIVVDNGSGDGSVKFLEEISKSKTNIVVLRNEENLGPSVARNQGIEKANGKYVAFLDNDTRVHLLWLKEAIKVFEADSKVGACQCKLILDDSDDIIDCVGEYLGQYGFLVQVAIAGEEKDRGQYDRQLEILAAKSAGMIVRRDILKKIGGFDDDFFIYLEETDLCWRIWLQGYKVVLIPSSTVYHKFGTTSKILAGKSNFLVKFHGTKNYILTLIKNLEFKNLLKILPIHIGIWISIAFFFLFKRQFKSAKWIIQGIFWNLVNYKKIIKKRKTVQEKRVVKDKEIFPKIYRKKSFNYFVDKLRRKNKVGYAVGWDKGE